MPLEEKIKNHFKKFSLNLKELSQSQINLVYFVLLFTGVIFLSLFHISGSSIDNYYRMYENSETRSDNLLYGNPRMIRGDEWSIVTPFTISQSTKNFEAVNEYTGDGQNYSVILDIPSNHWGTFFKPSNYIFFISPSIEFSVAFKWWIRALFLILSVYLLIQKITKSTKFAFLASLIVFFAPFVQWWYSTAGIEIISYTMLNCYFVILLLESKTKKSIVLSSFGLLYFVLCTLLTVYPPFIISMSLGAVFFMIGYLLNNYNEIQKNLLKEKIVAFIFSVLMVSGVLGLYYVSLKETINVIINTKYPGLRSLTGGTMSPKFLFSAFENFLFTNETKGVPPLFGNQSEGSNFFLYGLVVIPFSFIQAIVAKIKKTKVDYIALLLSLYLIASLIWVFVGYPSFIAKLTLIDKVPEQRMLIGIGIWSTILMFYFLYNFKLDFKSLKNKDLYFVFKLILGFAFSALVIYFAYRLHILYPDYIKTRTIIFVAICATIGVFLLIYKQRIAFALFLLVLSIFSTININPLYVGISAINNLTITNEIKKIDHADGGNSKWIALNDGFLGNLLIANGIHTLNGTNIYPQLSVWKKLDPDGKYDFYYNRYAHVSMQSNLLADPTEIKFEQNVPTDALVLDIDPCNQFFKANNVKFFVSPIDIKSECIKEIKRVNTKSRTAIIYEYK